MKEPDYLGPEFFSSNRKKLRELFGGTAPIVIAGNSLMQKSADATYQFSQDSNFWYLSGVNEPGFILVLETDKEYLIAPKTDTIRETFDGSPDISKISSQSGIETVIEHDEGWKQLSRRLSKVKHVATIQPASIYIPQLNMFTSPAKAQLVLKIKEENQDLNLIDLRPFLSSLRSVKSMDEIELIRLALRETHNLYKIIDKKLPKAEFEYEILAELQKELTLKGLDFAYDPIIASGSNALTLHYTANRSKIDKSAFILLDIGARYKNYNADITRTITASPTKRQLNVWNAVLSVHDFALNLLKPGVNLVTYEEAVTQYMGEKLRELGLIRTISKENVRKYYPHATSHFLGIDTHDVGDHTLPLVPGMILTVEPGIYIKDENIGVRLEDMVVITENGIEILSKDIPLKPDSLS